MFGWRWVQSWGDHWRGSVRKVKERETSDTLCVQRNVPVSLKNTLVLVPGECCQCTGVAEGYILNVCVFYCHKVCSM